MTVAPSAPLPPHGALFYVMAVNIVIWAGLFLYLFYLDRKVRAASSGSRPETKS
jgi:CcmD family protein